MESKKTSWGEIGESFLKLTLNILLSSAVIWLTVNLFFSAFSIVFRLTFVQAVSIFMIALMLKIVFGIGDRK